MASAPKQISDTEPTNDEEQTSSSKAVLLLQLSSMLASASLDPAQLGQLLGVPAGRITEIDKGLEDAKSKFIHVLESFKDRHGEGWKAKLEDVVREQLENPNLARQLQDSTTALSQKPASVTAQEAIPETGKTGSGADDTEKGSHSGHSGHSSGWEMTSGGGGERHGGSHGDGEFTSQSFERVSEENLFLLRDGDHPSKEESQHPSLDHPEMSHQIAKVGEALKVVSDLLGNVDGISQLTTVVPQILQLVRQMKSQKMLRLVFEEENFNLKQDLQGANEIIRELRETQEKLESEVADLKKAAEDKSLKDYDYVTRKEASEIKDEEKKREEPVTSPTASTQPTEGVSMEAYEALQKKIISLKQKLSEVVKLNHSWDDQYHRMEAALRVEVEAAKAHLADRNLEFEKREKERDEILVAAKHRVEKAETERGELQKTVDQMKQQLDKVTRYANSLQGHKQDLELEVKRLNQALQQKMEVKGQSVAPPAGGRGTQETSRPGAGARAGAGAGAGAKRGDQTKLLSHEERSILASLSQTELMDELGLLKQQLEVYRSDFYNEQRDRQRAMGELDEIKTELHRTKKKMEKQKNELQIFKDQALAFEYHAKERNIRPPTNRPARPVKQSGPSELVPHGGTNYAMNDEYVDCGEESEFPVCYPPSSSLDENLDNYYQKKY